MKYSRGFFIMYSKTEFPGYTHRFIVELTTEISTHTLQIYSDSKNYSELDEFIDNNKSEKVVDFRITHRASKEEDEIVKEFINSIK